MKLYYSAGACSLSPHIVALEAGIALSLEKVDGKAKRTEGGADFWQVNPKGYVPALVLDNGELLTEGPAIVQYLADLKPESGLAPANGTLARYLQRRRGQEHLWHWLLHAAQYRHQARTVQEWSAHDPRL